MNTFNMKLISNFDGIEKIDVYKSKSLGTIFSLLRFLIVNAPAHNGNFKAYVFNENLTIRVISYNLIDGFSNMVIMRGS